ncbi:MAG: peptidase M15 [Firmicutes bacterium HGW-Firmicutes-7]|nr:MAG: peptidase M15 [Firmicutes bacterium HGW-Firmicutes-7]
MSTTLTLFKNEIYRGNLILVNAKFPLVTHSNVELIPTNEKYSDILLERSAATILSHIMRDVNCIDEIVPVSGYRSKEKQEQIYLESLQESGQEFTEKYVALPNHSEHQTGLAIDLGLKKDVIDFIRPDFPYKGICDEFRKTAPQYGFIERYPSGKETITGIAHEPWHFRFVGFPHSKIIVEQELSLEEYIQDIKKYTYDGKHLEVIRGEHKIEIFYAPILSFDKITLCMPEYCSYQVSGNNADGFIITLWR